MDTQTPQPSLLDLVRRTPATYALAALNVVAFIAESRLGSTTDVAVLVRAGALERSHVWAGEWWRLGTAMFLHAGLLHIAANVGFGVPWCRMVERALGTARFLGLYLASGIAASAASLLLQDSVAVGASGALFGAIGAALALHRRALGTWRAFAANRGTIVLAAQLAAWAILGAVWLPIDQFAHAGGFAAGAAAAWLLTRPPSRPRGAWIAFGAALLALCVAAGWPRPVVTRWEAERRDEAIESAFRRGDAAGARRFAGEAWTRGQDTPVARYFRGRFLAEDGDLASALEVLRPLARSKGPLREDARRIAGWAAVRLGYRYVAPGGAANDPVLAGAYFDESCAYGDREGCRAGEQLRGR